MFRKVLNWLVPPTEPIDRSLLVEEPRSSTAKFPDIVDWADMAPEPVHQLPVELEVLTETATVVIYDLEALAHRLNDDIDWWADPGPELDELKNRNLLILGVGADGFYDVDIAIAEPANHQRYSLQFPSGLVFIGPGDLMTGAGAQPNGHTGGVLLSIEPGDYTVSVQRIEDERISIALKRGAPFENDIREPVRI